MFDPILAELRQFRDELSDQFHGDVTAILNDLRERGKAAGRQTVSFPPRLYEKPFRHGVIESELGNIKEVLTSNGLVGNTADQ